MSVTHRERLRVVRFARKQIRNGVPYKFGAAGPDAYDCSGLFMVGWERATDGRVLFPHNADLISHDTRVRLAPPTSKNLRKLRLGDPIFYYGEEHPGHIAIYVGRSLSGRKRMIMQAGDVQVGLQKIAMRKYAQPSEIGYIEH